LTGKDHFIEFCKQSGMVNTKFMREREKTHTHACARTHAHTQSISCMADATKLWTLSLRVFCVLCHHLKLWEICAKKMCLLNDDQHYVQVLQSTTHFHYCHRDRDMFFVQTVKVDKYWYIHFTQNWSTEVWNGGGPHLIMEDKYTLQTGYSENDSHHILYISQGYAW